MSTQALGGLYGCVRGCHISRSGGAAPSHSGSRRGFPVEAGRIRHAQMVRAAMASLPLAICHPEWSERANGIEGFRPPEYRTEFPPLRSFLATVGMTVVSGVLATVGMTGVVRASRRSG